jgi:hypothetical protein
MIISDASPSIVARQAARDRTLSFELLVERLKKAGMYIDDKIILSVKTSLQHR